MNVSVQPVQNNPSLWKISEPNLNQEIQYSLPFKAKSSLLAHPCVKNEHNLNRTSRVWVTFFKSICNLRASGDFD